jgi:hypothetical protein
VLLMRAWLRRRCRTERGATIVEAAIVSPLFFLLVLGLMEFGNFFRNSMAVNNAAVNAAREGSTSANDGFADYNVLVTAQRLLSDLDRGADYVVVYKATSPSAPVPEACKVASVPGQCNRYTGPQLDALASGELTTSRFGAQAITDSTKVDAGYPPLGRQYKRTADGHSVTEYLGVHVSVTYRPITGVLKGERRLNATTVIPIEPRAA